MVGIVDKKNELVVSAELPGMDKKDVKINLEEGKVEIRAEKKEEKEDKKKDYYRKESSYKEFYKAITLPYKVNSDKAKFKFEKGVLTLRLPKSRELKKKRTIKLK